MEVKQLDGPAARLKLVQQMPYGTRIDVRLDAAATDPTEVLVALSCSFHAEQSEASP